MPSTSLRGIASGLFASFLRRGLSSEYVEKIKEFLGISHVVLFPQARIALYSIMKALLPEGSEVIVSAYNVPVVIEYLEAAGVKLRYVDIEEGGFQMDVTKAREAIGEQTRAILISHMYGQSVDFSSLIAVCKEKSILLIEDAAQAFGSPLESDDPRLAGRLCGTVGDVGVFSTGIYKKFSTVLGGFVVTDDPQLHERLQAFKDEHHGSAVGALPILAAIFDGIQFIVASNRLIFPLIFSLLKEKIRNINFSDEKRRGVIDPSLLPYTFFEALQSALGLRSFSKHGVVNIPFVRNSMALRERLSSRPAGESASCSYLHYPVTVRDRRRAIIEINDAGYDAGPGKFFNYGGDSCPNAGRTVEQNLSLPIHRGVDSRGLERMASIVERRRSDRPATDPMAASSGGGRTRGPVR